MFFLTGEIPNNIGHPGRKSLYIPPETKTIQSAREDADINVIVSRMRRTGVLPTTARVPTAGDFSEQVTDYHTAMNMVINARNEFNKLPPKLRSRFSNDPQQLMDYLTDPQNNEESYKLGLRTKPPVEPEPAPIKVEVIAPAAPAA